jgi:penicillin-binding protein 2
MAIAALNTGKRSPTQIIYDNGSYMFGNHRFRSHGDGGLGAVDMVRSIVASSNVYYYSLANEMGVDLMHEQLEPFSFGRKTGIDLEGEVTGDLPSTEWKRRKFKRPEMQKWYAGETISLGIGQGYNNFTMVQLASAMATLVSGGQRFEPRLVSEIENVVDHKHTVVSHQALTPLPLAQAHVDLLRRALYGVTQEGTSTRVFIGAQYKSGGKTGTAQAKSIGANEKYNAGRMSEYLRDHSLYTAFAPLDDPQIALAVIVENAGFGAEAAAPIARRVLDYLIAGNYPTPEDIALVQKGQIGAPVGPQRRAADVPLPTPRNSAVATTVASSASASTAAPVPAARPSSPAASAAAAPAASMAAAAPIRLARNLP